MWDSVVKLLSAVWGSAANCEERVQNPTSRIGLFLYLRVSLKSGSSNFISGMVYRLFNTCILTEDLNTSNMVEAPLWMMNLERQFFLFRFTIYV
jgi:hypothetical protein